MKNNRAVQTLTIMPNLRRIKTKQNLQDIKKNAIVRQISTMNSMKGNEQYANPNLLRNRRMSLTLTAPAEKGTPLTDSYRRQNFCFFQNVLWNHRGWAGYGDYLESAEKSQHSSSVKTPVRRQQDGKSRERTDVPTAPSSVLSPFFSFPSRPSQTPFTFRQKDLVSWEKLRNFKRNFAIFLKISWRNFIRTEFWKR